MPEHLCQVLNLHAVGEHVSCEGVTGKVGVQRVSYASSLPDHLQFPIIHLIRHFRNRHAISLQDFHRRRQQLIDIRQKEAVLSAEYLGVTDVQFLGLSDGGFYRFEELVEGIAQAVARFCPQVIFAPDPSVASECHVDHLNAGKAARQIACHAPYPGIMAAHGACGSAPVSQRLQGGSGYCAVSATACV